QRLAMQQVECPQKPCFDFRADVIEEFVVEMLGKEINRSYRLLMVPFDDVGLFYLLQQLDEFVVHLVQYRGIVDRCVTEYTSVRERIAAIGIELHHRWLNQVTQIGLFAKRVYQFMWLCGVDLLHLQRWHQKNKSFKDTEI